MKLMIDIPIDKYNSIVFNDVDKLRECAKNGKVIEEEDILKFYYVESLDDYWIGKRLDTMYYAEWNFELQAFVWTHSKYLPWGEHVVAPNTLWKEHTYPSEPKEIPFTKWIKGFLNKHGREQQPCEDCISREAVNVLIDELARAISDERCFIPRGRSTADIMQDILDLPSVQPQRPKGKWIFKNDNIAIPTGYYQCSECEEGKLLVKDNFCPNCGSYNGGEG